MWSWNEGKKWTHTPHTHTHFSDFASTLNLSGLALPTGNWQYYVTPWNVLGSSSPAALTYTQQQYLFLSCFSLKKPLLPSQTQVWRSLCNIRAFFPPTVIMNRIWSQNSLTQIRALEGMTQFSLHKGFTRAVCCSARQLAGKLIKNRIWLVNQWFKKNTTCWKKEMFRLVFRTLTGMTEFWFLWDLAVHLSNICYKSV